MASLVKCRVCGRRVSEEAAREIKGALCCPPCYEKLTAKLRQKEAGPEAPAPAAAPPRPARPGHVSPSEKLARKAAAYRGRGLAPDAPDLPDLPDIPAELADGPRPRGPGFSLSPEALGHGIYAALAGLGLYAVWRFTDFSAAEKPGPVGLVLLGVAAFMGFPALLLGLLELVKSGVRGKQVCGGLALAAGIFLVWSVGTTFLSGLRSSDPLSVVGIESGSPDKKPAPKPEPGTKPEPGPKPGPKPEPKPEPGPGPKPEPKPEPKPAPKPEPTSEQQLRAEISRLVLTTAEEARRKNARLVELSAMQQTAFTAMELKPVGAERVEGWMEFRVAGPHRRFAFVTEKRDGKWRVVSIDLPGSALRAEQAADGSWKVSEAETSDPGVRYERALRGLDVAGLPSASRGAPAGGASLAPYGELAAGDEPPRVITAGAAGVILPLPRGTTMARVLPAAAKGDAYRPFAVLVTGGRGPVFAMPEVTAEERQGKFKAAVVELRSRKDEKDGTVKFEYSISGSLARTIDAEGLRFFAGRIKDFRSVAKIPGDMPLRFVPAGDVPLELVVKLIDLALEGGFPVSAMTLDPSKAK